MTPDLFTRLAHRALGDGGLTMLPGLEPEPPGDEDVVESPCEADAAPVPDVPRPSDVMHPSTGQAVTAPVRMTPATPVPSAAVLLPVPETLPSPGRPGLTPDTAQQFRLTAAVAPTPPPTEVGRDDVSADAGARHLPADRDDAPADAGARLSPPRTGILEPVPLPSIGPPVPPVHRQPDQAADSGTSVEVTVGRIEIRVRPPAQGDTAWFRRAVAPAPALTLEEYLRRRDASS